MIAHNQSQERILLRKLEKMFPDEGERKSALEILEEYGVESNERGAARVRLAILKISQNSIESLRKNTLYAKQDYRDVLCWAEYPNQSKNWPMPNSPKKQELIEKDKQQYKEWLNDD